MVKPYLSRLRPAESGRRLHPRPRSRFEPAPRLPIDGLAIASPGPSLPSALDATADRVEIKLERDAPYPYLAGSPGAAAAPREQGPPPVRTAAPEPDTRDEERAPARAARAAGAPLQSPSPASAPTGESRPPAPAADEEDLRSAHTEGAVGREHAPAPRSATRRSAPQPRRAPPDQAPVLSGRAGPGGRPAAQPAPPPPAPPERPAPAPPAPEPPERPPLAPRRQVDQTSQETEAPQLPARRPDDGARPAMRRPGPPADAPADRVQAMARWLRDADAASVRAGTTTRRSMDPQSAPVSPSRVPSRPGPAEAHTDVTVTIGRIEVKAPAADPAPARPPSSGPRRRASSLGDYLESRTRARGRPR
ncbi:MAG: hypothetical protein ABSF03_27755 [Streptosporangiaceae bacterium]|jgi:hypothetical protein